MPNTDPHGTTADRALKEARANIRTLADREDLTDADWYAVVQMQATLAVAEQLAGIREQLTKHEPANYEIDTSNYSVGGAR